VNFTGLDQLWVLKPPQCVCFCCIFFPFIWFPVPLIMRNYLLLRNILQWLLDLVCLEGVSSTLFSDFKLWLWHRFVVTVCLICVRMSLCHFQFHILTFLKQQVFIVIVEKMSCCVCSVLYFYNEKISLGLCDVNYFIARFYFCTVTIFSNYS